MPIYEYRCGECSQVFEALQRVNDEPLDTCRHCGGPAERIISSPAIHFVGSGWYVTDYARKGKEGKEKSEKAESAGKGKEDRSAGAAKNGSSSGGEASGKGGESGTGAGQSQSSKGGGKASGGRTERRAGAAT